MTQYLIYQGDRTGSFTVNSRAHPGLKLRVTPGLPFGIDTGDEWIAALSGFFALTVSDWRPQTRRLPGTDESYCSRYEGAFLEGLVSTCPDPARVVEIGTGKGNSLLHILYGLALHHDVHVWSVDLLECADARRYVDSAGILPGRYSYLTGDSCDLATEIDEPLDLVYIDGSHTGAGVRSDILAWRDQIKSGGVMAFHDYGDPRHDVTAAIDELMADGPWQYVGQVGHAIAFERTGDA